MTAAEIDAASADDRAAAAMAAAAATMAAALPRTGRAVDKKAAAAAATEESSGFAAVVWDRDPESGGSGVRGDRAVAAGVRCPRRGPSLHELPRSALPLPPCQPPAASPPPRRALSVGPPRSLLSSSHRLNSGSFHLLVPYRRSFLNQVKLTDGHNLARRGRHRQQTDRSNKTHHLTNRISSPH